jgi:predicted secreted protein
MPKKGEETMQYKLGFEPKMYIGPAGSAPATEAKNVKDVTVNLESAEVDASSRQSGIFKFYLSGQIDPSIEFTMNADADDTVQTTLRTQWLARGAVAVKVELGDGYFFMSDCIVTNFSNDQALEDVVSYSVTLRPTITTSAFLPTITNA